MIDAGRIGWDPALPGGWIIALAIAALAFLGFYFVRGGKAPVTRAFGLGLTASRNLC
jgi:hypothetical protein